MLELDKRVIRAHEENSVNKTFDEQKMTITVTLLDSDDEQLVTFPAKFIVCDVCLGKGRHVDPNIDAHGITQEEFSSWSHDERESYMSGGYDIDCMTCHGKRVIPKINRKAILDEKLVNQLKKYDEQVKDDLEFERLARQERMMGA